MNVIVIRFITLDGAVSLPDGSVSTPAGGQAFRHGPQTVTVDKFQPGRTLGEVLPGRATWELCSRLSPERDDPFSARMNAVPTPAATRTLTGTSARANSRVPGGGPPASLHFQPAQQADAAVLARYGRAAR